MAHRELRHLSEMLGTYFDREWARGRGVAEDRLTDMLSELPEEHLRRGAAEIARLLDGSLCENQVRDVLLYEVGCHYAFERDGLEASSWLQHVHDRIKQRGEVALTVLRGTASDVPAVMTLVRRCIEEMSRRGIDQWDDVYPSRERFEADALAGSLYVVPGGEGLLLGAFTLDGHQDVEYADVSWAFEHPRVAVVHRLMVEPTVQGRGVARALMRFAEETAAALGCGVMRLDAFTLNPFALRLYGALGYRDAGGVTFRKGRFRCFEKRLGECASSRVGPAGDD